MAGTKFKALAANRLSDGVAVWGTAAPGGFRWTEAWDAVIPVAAEDAEILEAWGIEEAGRDAVVSERMIDVAAAPFADAGTYLPTRLRERIVATGPTVRPDLGKQADQRLHAQAA